MKSFRYIFFSAVFLGVLTLLSGTSLAQECSPNISPQDSIDACIEISEFSCSRETITTCFQQVAAATNDPTACEYEWEGTPVNRGELDACYLSLGTENNNINVCYSIADVFLQSECISNVAMTTQNIDLCDEVTRNYGDCYLGVAIALQDAEICTDNWEEDQCISSVNSEGATCITRNTCYDAVEYSFSDILPSHNNYEAIHYIHTQGIVDGYLDGTFQPNETINRAELLKIIIESKFSDDDISVALDEYRSKNYWYVDLTDVDIDSWYGPYVRIAIREGIINGYSDQTFRPSQSVNFVEALKIVLNAYNIDYNTKTYPWYGGLVEKGAALNLNPLDITSFDLQITRAQMAEIMTRVLKYQDGTLTNYLGNSFELKQTYYNIKNGISGTSNNAVENEGTPPMSDISLLGGEAEIAALSAQMEAEMTALLADAEEPNIIDCGTLVFEENSDMYGLSCFTEAARSCSPAKLVTELEIGFFGMNIYTETYREIKGTESERCTLYQRTEDQRISITEETRQRSLDNGKTEEEIEQPLLEANQAAQESVVGKDSTCHYPLEDLVNMLEQEQEGRFSGSTSDVQTYQCTGSRYEIEAPAPQPLNRF